MNQVAVTKPHAKKGLIETMAEKVSMDPKAFEKTIRATCMPKEHTTEQFGALMLTANTYGLNPLLKEIYAFPTKGGGIAPIVSIDGWLRMINTHPNFDGMSTEFMHDDSGNLVSCRCSIFRTDRSRPIIVEEYLAECKRNTDPWKMEHRMLRHKATMQCGRYAFSFAGVYDEDEGRDIRDAGTDNEPPAPPAIDAEFDEIPVGQDEPPAPPVRKAETRPKPQDSTAKAAPQAVEEEPPAPPVSRSAATPQSEETETTSSEDLPLLSADDVGVGDSEPINYDDELERCREDLGEAVTKEILDEIWDDYKEVMKNAPDEHQQEADRAYNENHSRLSGS